MDLDKSDVLKRSRLYVVVTTGLCRQPIDRVVEGSLKGGADVIQLREKGIYEADYVTLARRLKKIVSDAGKLFIVNDNPSVALSSGADGVHVGQSDVTLLECRLLLGPEAIIGVSTHDLAQARTAADGGADYLGFGPVYETSTKVGAGPALGLPELGAVASSVSVPVYAIGGFTAERATGACDVGSHGVAVSSAVCLAEDPEVATREIRSRLRY